MNLLRAIDINLRLMRKSNLYWNGPILITVWTREIAQFFMEMIFSTTGHCETLQHENSCIGETHQKMIKSRLKSTF